MFWNSKGSAASNEKKSLKMHKYLREFIADCLEFGPVTTTQKNTTEFKHNKIKYRKDHKVGLSIKSEESCCLSRVPFSVTANIHALYIDHPQKGLPVYHSQQALKSSKCSPLLCPETLPGPAYHLHWSLYDAWGVEHFQNKPNTEKKVQTADALSAVTRLRGFGEENRVMFYCWIIIVILVWHKNDTTV